MSKIIIGQSDGKNVHLDIESFLRTHLLIWASTGGGKSYLIRRIAEQLFGKIPVFIIDREGEFSTLREKFGFVLVGPGGETPADPRSAKLVAERLLELRASAVFDLFELGIEARHEWVRNFFEALVNAHKRLWGPTAVILDEAHTFDPEKGQGESVASGAVSDFMGVARKRGFGAILATQRLSKLSKNATAEMYNQAAGPTASQADRDRAAYELGMPKSGPETKVFTESLRTLDPGNFYFQGRAVSIDRILVSVGAVETAHSSAGSSKYNAKAPPTPDEIKGLLPKLADLPQMAEEKARTEAELRKEIKDLKSQLRKVPTETKEIRVADPKAIAKATATLRVLLEDAMKIIVKVNAIGFNGASISAEQIKETLNATAVKISKMAEYLIGSKRNELERLKRESERMLSRITEGLGKNEDVNVDLTVTRNDPVTLRESRPPARRESIGHNPSGNPELKGPHRKILKALAELRSIDKLQPPKEMVAAWAGYSPGGGAFQNPLGALRGLGLVDYPGNGTVSLTDAGVAEIGEYPAPDQDEVNRRVMDILKGPHRKILSVLISQRGIVIPKATLAEESGYAEGGGAFQNPLGSLRTAGFVEYPSSGMVKAADWLFVD